MIYRLLSSNTTGMKMNKKSMKEYRIWRAMKARCYAPSCKNDGYYQKDGIKVCDRWLHSFENFMADMGAIPGDDYSIDRIDNAKSYSPSNCRWVHKSQQSRNRRNVINVAYNGEVRPLKEWARLLNINYDTLRSRVVRHGNAFEMSLDPKPKRYITIGDKSMYMSDWCKELGVSATAIYSYKCKHKVSAKEAVIHYMNLGGKHNAETTGIR